jgi:hypothetical protein
MKFKEIRQAFWANHPQFKKDFRVTYKQNQYYTEIRVSFVDFVDHLQKCGEITERQANRISL